MYYTNAQNTSASCEETHFYFVKVHVLDKPSSLAEIFTVWTDIVKCAINQVAEKFISADA